MHAVLSDMRPLHGGELLLIRFLGVPMKGVVDKLSLGSL